MTGSEFNRCAYQALNHLLLLGLLLLSGFCKSVRAAEPAHWQNPNYLTYSFLNIALNNEHQPQKSPVRKWNSTIRYFLVHQTADEELNAKLIRMHFEQLTDITGLSIVPAESQEQANYLIVLTSENQLKDDLLHYFHWKSSKKREQFFRESICLGTFTTDINSVITQATVLIPVDRARDKGQLMACIVEELTQVLGLPNDSDLVFPSIFNDRSTDIYLSGLDFLLLKMLYDPRVKAGMNEDAVRPVLQEITTEFQQNGLLDAAEQEAISIGLWQFDQ